MSKPVILFFPFGFLSHYLRYIVLARRWSSFFDIRFASHPAYEEYIKKEGFRTFEAESFDEAGVLTKLEHFDFSWLSISAIEPVFLSQVNAIERHQPVIVVGDNSPALKMAAAKTRVFYISLQNGYMSKYYPDTRHISRRHPTYGLLRMLPSRLARYLTRVGESISFARIHRPFRQLRKRYQLSRSCGYMDELEGDLNFICDFSVIFPQRRLPSNYEVLGPLIYDMPHGYNRVDINRDKAKKTIFVNMGSTGQWNNIAFLNDVRFRRYNIITAGCTQSVLSPGIASHFPFLHASEILPVTDLVICHGGNGTVNQCLRYGVPMLFKTTYFEQEWNARAIEKIGWGQTIDDIDKPDLLEEVIEKWMDAKPMIKCSPFEA